MMVTKQVRQPGIVGPQMSLYKFKIKVILSDHDAIKVGANFGRTVRNTINPCKIKHPFQQANSDIQNEINFFLRQT